MIIALDIETTGLESGIDKIIEIAMVQFDEKTGKTIKEFSQLVNPEVEIPEMITGLTGITQTDVADKPRWSELLTEVAAFIGTDPIVGHNVNFDIWFLRSYWIELRDNIILDTFEVANFVVLDAKSLSLEPLCHSFDIEITWAHRALNDVNATISLFMKLVELLKKAPVSQLQMLDYIANRCESKTYWFLYNEVLGKKSRIFDEQIFIKNLLKVLAKKKRDTRLYHDSSVDSETISQFIQKSEVLEVRDNQKNMMEAIADNFEKQSKVVIEAPTGVWKTFAYLIPSIAHSVKTGEQVFVSTSTKALQDQIYYKDLEFLSQELWVDFSFSKLKWRNNYIGIASFIAFLWIDSTFDQVEATFILKILFWLHVTKLWELDELDCFGKEYSFMREINSDDFFTFSKDNVYSPYEFTLRARKNAKNSNIVVINNSILFQDVHSDNSILGKVENVILDEAHTLEDIVTSALKESFTYREIEGHLQSITKILHKSKKSEVFSGHFFDAFLFDMSVLFDNFHAYLGEKMHQDDLYKNLLVREDFYETYVSDDESKSFYSWVQIQIIDILDTLWQLDDATYVLLWRDISFLESLLKATKILSKKDNSSTYIKTIAFNNSNQELSVWFTLLNIGSYLQSHLWEKVQSCVLTSATLKIWDDFSYIKKILSLDDFRELTFESDFDYAKQSLLFIPSDIGSIKNNLPQVILFILDICLVAKGNILVLFTSFYSIKETHSQILPECRAQGIDIYAQSSGGWKHKLIEWFKRNADHGVLIGTDTFWEWIDIPWEDLKYLVIHKTPFPVPNEPVFQARSQLFQNSFSEYSLPKAILKLKQWFWRLIRTKTDTWIIIFLDDRIYSTRWGEILYNAFPKEINKKTGWSQEFIKILSHKKKA